MKDLRTVPWLLDDEEPGSILANAGSDGHPTILTVDVNRDWPDNTATQLAEHIVRLHNGALLSAAGSSLSPPSKAITWADVRAAQLNFAKLAAEVEAERYPGTPMTTDQARPDIEKELVSILDRIGGMAVGMMDNPFQAGELNNISFGVMIDILAERQRQIDKGWTPAHDDEHEQDGRLAIAGAAYALQAITPAATTAPPADGPKRPWDAPTITEGPLSRHKIAQLLTAHCVALSPCNHTKPLSPREQLVRSGACIVAEIERLDRISNPTEG